MYTVLAGGIGAARFLRGLVRAVDPRDITVIVNVGDDITLHGLHVSPDIDTLIYTLSGVVHPEQEWGRDDEGWRVAEELERLGAPTWFRLGDRDIATHIVRTQRLRDGATLSAVTSELARARGVAVTLIPATDEPMATRVTLADGRDLHFQEYWVRERAGPAVTAIHSEGADRARPAPGVLEAIRDAAAVGVCPSNPGVAIGTILAVPEVRDALVATHAPVVGVSPIVGGAVVRGMADKLLPAVGAETSAAGVAALYAPWLDGWVIDRADLDQAAAVRALGVDVAVTDTMMDDVDVATALARTTLALAARLGAQPAWVSDPDDPSGGVGPTPGEARRRAHGAVGT